MTPFERRLLTHFATACGISGDALQLERGIRRLKALRYIVVFGGRFVVTLQGRVALAEQGEAA